MIFGAQVCASKDALFVARLSNNLWKFVGGKVQYVSNQAGDCQIMHPSIVKRVIVTDQGAKTPFQFFNQQTQELVRVLEIEPMTLLIEVGCSDVNTHVAFLQIPAEDSEPLKPLFWIAEEEVDIYKKALSLHIDFRKHEISQYMASKAMRLDRCSDFITHFTGTSSITAHVKTQGRAHFSVDKAPRSTRSVSLPPQVEIDSICTMLVILYSCHEERSYKKWSITKIVFEIFKRTKAYQVLLKYRPENDELVMNQMRRWFPFCKVLAKESDFFSTAECPVFVAEAQNTHMRIKWMNKIARPIFEGMKEWIKEGERSQMIIQDDEGGDSTVKEWYNVRRKEFDDLTSPSTGKTSYHFQTVSCKEDEMEEEEPEEDADSSTPNPLLDDCKQTTEVMKAIELVRTQTLTRLLGQSNDKVQQKRVQQQFQALAQNVCSHKRNFKSLVETVEKMASIFLRMQSMEKNIQQNMRVLTNMTGEDDGSMEEMKRLVTANFKAVEKAAKSEMREALQPNSAFLLRKKLQNECDDYLGDMMTYLDDAGDAEPADND